VNDCNIVARHLIRPFTRALALHAYGCVPCLRNVRVLHVVSVFVHLCSAWPTNIYTIYKYLRKTTQNGTIPHTGGSRVLAHA
jgi:hypothetical protein